MSARKLRRLAGFVFVLAVAFGGASAGTIGIGSVSGGDTSAVEVGTLEWVWD
jgi:hypothetical protein